MQPPLHASLLLVVVSAVRHVLCVASWLHPASFVHTTHSDTVDDGMPFSCRNAFMFVNCVAWSTVLSGCDFFNTTNIM